MVLSGEIWARSNPSTNKLYMLKPELHGAPRGRDVGLQEDQRNLKKHVKANTSDLKVHERCA